MYVCLSGNCNLRYDVGPSWLCATQTFFMQPYVPTCGTQNVRLGFGPFVCTETTCGLLCTMTTQQHQQQHQ